MHLLGNILNLFMNINNSVLIYTTANIILLKVNVPPHFKKTFFIVPDDLIISWANVLHNFFYLVNSTA